jgi:hypothetical protein
MNAGAAREKGVDGLQQRFVTVRGGGVVKQFRKLFAHNVQEVASTACVKSVARINLQDAAAAAWKKELSSVASSCVCDSVHPGLARDSELTEVGKESRCVFAGARAQQLRSHAAEDVSARNRAKSPRRTRAALSGRASAPRRDTMTSKRARLAVSQHDFPSDGRQARRNTVESRPWAIATLTCRAWRSTAVAELRTAFGGPTKVHSGEKQKHSVGEAPAAIHCAVACSAILRREAPWTSSAAASAAKRVAARSQRSATKRNSSGDACSQKTGCSRGARAGAATAAETSSRAAAAAGAAVVRGSGAAPGAADTIAVQERESKLRVGALRPDSARFPVRVGARSARPSGEVASSLWWRSAAAARVQGMSSVASYANNVKKCNFDASRLRSLRTHPAGKYITTRSIGRAHSEQRYQLS